MGWSVNSDLEIVENLKSKVGTVVFDKLAWDRVLHTSQNRIPNMQP
jgi:hypothetical protein